MKLTWIVLILTFLLTSGFAIQNNQEFGIKSGQKFEYQIFFENNLSNLSLTTWDFTDVFSNESLKIANNSIIQFALTDTSIQDVCCIVQANEMELFSADGSARLYNVPYFDHLSFNPHFTIFVYTDWSHFRDLASRSEEISTSESETEFRFEVSSSIERAWQENDSFMMTYQYRGYDIFSKAGGLLQYHFSEVDGIIQGRGHFRQKLELISTEHILNESTGLTRVETSRTDFKIHGFYFGNIIAIAILCWVAEKKKR